MADNKVNSGLLEFSEDQKVFVALDAETSEVKKAVTIDGDGVETDIQGVQPTGKKEITTTAEVNVASYATAQVVDEDLVAGNIKKDVDILGVVGSYEAPASDFSTAEVTIINNKNMATTIHLSNADELEGTPFSPASVPDVYLQNNETLIIKAILYKGVAMATNSPDYTVTGNISVINGQLIITGDGTITIS